MKIILGIDPGSQFTGYGAVQMNGKAVRFLGCGVIAPPPVMKFNDRLSIIAEELELLIAKIKPTVTVVERIFLGKNADSAFKLGHARGIAVASCIRAGSEVVEYAARAVKKGITGSGAATKEQVQTVLYASLGLSGKTRADASDALALAYFHAINQQIEERIGRQQEIG